MPEDYTRQDPRLRSQQFRSTRYPGFFSAPSTPASTVDSSSGGTTPPEEEEQLLGGALDQDSPDESSEGPPDTGEKEVSWENAYDIGMNLAAGPLSAATGLAVNMMTGQTPPVGLGWADAAARAMNVPTPGTTVGRIGKQLFGIGTSSGSDSGIGTQQGFGGPSPEAVDQSIDAMDVPGVDNPGPTAEDVSFETSYDTGPAGPESSAGPTGPDGGGGDGGGGEKVICTALAAGGHIEPHIYAGDVEFGRLLPRCFIRGYHWWAKPYTRLMRRSSSAAWFARVFGGAWARQMAYLTGRSAYGHPLGIILMLVGLPVCGLISLFIKKE